MNNFKFVDREDGVVWFFALSLFITFLLVRFSSDTSIIIFLSPVLSIIGLLSLIVQKFTISLKDDQLEIFFGSGIFRRRYQLDDLIPVQIIDIDPRFATGVRLFQGGWLYGIKGQHALEMQCRDGSVFYLRTTQVDNLQRALKQLSKQ